MRMMIVMTREEIQERIAYSLICTTRMSSLWDTMKRKRLWKQIFSESERESASRLFAQARIWYLVKGVPDEVTMSLSTFDLWQKLEDFCIRL